MLRDLIQKVDNKQEKCLTREMESLRKSKQKAIPNKRSNPPPTKKKKEKKKTIKKMLESKITVAEVKNAFDGLISRLNI
jgi:hypothetical protein